MDCMHVGLQGRKKRVCLSCSKGLALRINQKKKKKLNKGVESNPGFSTRFHLHYPVDLWLASAKANLDQSSWLGWRRNCIEGYVPYFHQIPFFIFFP